MPGMTAQDQSHGVKLFDLATRRQVYQVRMGREMTRGGYLFDTREIRRVYDVFTGDLGAAHYGRSLKTGRMFVREEPIAGIMEWFEGALIWVCAVDPATNMPAFYSHVCRIHTIHHSSLAGGGNVIAGGEWIVEKGRLRKVSGNSGHYRPPLDALYRAVLHMAGAFHDDTTIFMYDTVADTWVERPIRNFISAPTDNGRYWIHPEAKPPGLA